MGKRQIEHQGVVASILPHAVVVSIVQETACASCAVANLCHSSEKQEKGMEIPCANVSPYRVGQEVTIVGSIGLGLRATLWAYVIPLVVLMGVMIMVAKWTENEGLAALVALASLIPYYIMLYLLRGQLQQKFTFRIINKTNS